MTTAAAATLGVAAPEGLLDAACRQARLLGASRTVAIAEVPVDASSHSQIAATAVRDGGEPSSVVRDLQDAFGADLPRMGVAYLGCLAAGVDRDRFEREIDAVCEVAGTVLVIEPEPAEGSRWVQPDGRAVRCSVRVGPAGELTPPPLRVAISDHQGKAAGIAAALVAAGHALVDDASLADVVLIDHDVPFHGKLPLVETCVAARGRAFLYPHGASAPLMAGWDGLYPISPLLSGVLVLADGHAEVGRRYGYPYPLKVIGWPLCDLAPRRPGPVHRVLFAPSHPPYHGNPRYPGRNAEIFARLLGAPVELTVRHIGSLEDNGLWTAPGVTYVPGDLDDSPGRISQIDASDAVVADRSTFGNLAVARGVTTVMWDSTLVQINDGSREPDHLDRYRELLRFPFDADDHDDIWDLLQAASQDIERTAVWSRRFIGKPLSTGALVAALRGM
ncbi:MAG: hypothetical protein ACR2N6_01865 [Miltoncostaeaceae bacterium]